MCASLDTNRGFLDKKIKKYGKDQACSAQKMIDVKLTTKAQSRTQRSQS
jgi:hypothetical protein